jgi:hypothetical protein
MQYTPVMLRSTASLISQLPVARLINDDLVRRIKVADKFHFDGEELMKRSMAYRTFLDT